MEKKCPRCNMVFTCEKDDITNCHCMNAAISPEGYKQINEKYNDCLCATCLKEIEKSQSVLSK